MQITTTLPSREVEQVFEPALGYSGSSTSLSENSADYREPLELLEELRTLHELRAYLETEF